MIDPEKLKSFLDALVKDTSLKQLADGTTFCNVGVSRVCGLFEYGGLSLLIKGKPQPMMARQMITAICEKNSGWLVCEGKQAADYALRGGFAISFMSMAPEPHDHVAVVYPAAMQASGSLGKFVPMVANIGKKNEIMKSSGAYPVAKGEAKYAILLEAA